MYSMGVLDAASGKAELPEGLDVEVARKGCDTTLKAVLSALLNGREGVDVLRTARFTDEMMKVAASGPLAEIGGLDPAKSALEVLYSVRPKVTGTHCLQLFTDPVCVSPCTLHYKKNITCVPIPQAFWVPAPALDTSASALDASGTG